MYFTEQPRFLNMVVSGWSMKKPTELLAAVQAIERRYGRDRNRETRNGPRSLDIDLLLAGSLVLHTSELTVPHPLMHERSFVLIPLLDLEPEIRDPRSGELFAASPAADDGVGVYPYRCPGYT